MGRSRVSKGEPNNLNHMGDGWVGNPSREHLFQMLPPFHGPHVAHIWLVFPKGTFFKTFKGYLFFMEMVAVLKHLKVFFICGLTRGNFGVQKWEGGEERNIKTYLFRKVCQLLSCMSRVIKAGRGDLGNGTCAVSILP